MDSKRGNVVSMVFQEPMTALNPSMKVGKQVAEAILNHRGVSKAEAMARAVELLDKVGIPDPAVKARNFPHQLSGGQRQRVVIAIALACDPTLIIADEPTTALDVTVQAEILELLRNLVKETNTALLLITHNMGVVADLSDRVVVMNAGKVIETGTTVQVLTEPAEPYTQALLAAVPTLPEAQWDAIIAEERAEEPTREPQHADSAGERPAHRSGAGHARGLRRLHQRRAQAARRQPGQPGHQPRRDRRPGRRIGLRQVDAGPRAAGPGPGDGRCDHALRRRRAESLDPGDPQAALAHRHHLPGSGRIP